MPSSKDSVDDNHGGFEQVSACFLKFKILCLDAAWLNSVWDGGGELASDLPADYEAAHANTVWHVLMKEAADVIGCLALHGHKASNVVAEEELESRMWSELADSGVSMKGITVVTCCFIERGVAELSGNNLRYADLELAILAAGFYLRLVSVPGSNAYRLFNPSFYEKTLAMLRMANRILKETSDLSGGRCESSCSNTGRKRGRTKAGISVKRSRARRRRHDGLGSEEEADCNDAHSSSESEEEVASESETLSSHDIQNLIRLLTNLLADFKHFLENYSLKTYEQLLDLTVQHLGESLILEARYPAFNLASFTLAILGALKTMCNPLHGAVDMLTWIILKNLIQSILCDASKKIAVFIVQLAREVPAGQALPSIRRLLQNVCFKTSDRADARNKQCAVTYFILDELPLTAYADVIKWFVAYSCSAKVAHRLFILELFSLILGHPVKKIPADDIDEDRIEFVSPACLLKTVLERCSDKSSAVRTKALSVLAASALSTEPNLNRLMLKMFVGRIAPVTQSICTAAVPDVEDNEKLISDAEAAVELLRLRTNDSKVHVRRAAIQVLQSITELHVDCVTPVNIEAIQVHCRDTSLLVRKQAMQSVSDLLLHYPSVHFLQQAWFEGILPMVVDQELTVQAKCVESVNDVIFRNIVPAAKSTDAYHHMAWNILHLPNCSSQESRHFLRKAVDAITKQGKMGPSITEALKTHIGTQNNVVAWRLLSVIVPCVAVKDTEFITSYWEKHQLDETDEVLLSVLVVMGEVFHAFDVSTRGTIMGQLAALLSEFRHDPMVISEMITTMSLLGQSNGADSEERKMFTDFCSSIMKHCDTYLSSIFLNKKGKTAHFDEERVVNHLFTIGELCLHCPSHVPKRVFLLMKSFLAAPSISRTTSPELPEQPYNQEGEEESQGTIHLRAGIQGSQGSQGTHSNDGIQGSQGDFLENCNIADVFSSLGNRRIRRVAFLALGKLCLQHELLAKQCVPALGRELEFSEDPFIRNNVVVIMADLCKKYTTLVDEYVPNVTACLRDKSVVVRRQTLLLLTNLLQEDYLKWKGPLFFHYMSTLVDESPEVRALADYGLREILNKRFPGLFQQQFIECIFHFNAYKNHEKYNKTIISEKDYRLFSLAGSNLREKRMKLYTFMLQNMTDEYRFQVMTKICQDILGGVVDETISLVASNGSLCANGFGLLQDSFSILYCDDIKLATLRNAPLDDAEEDIEAVALATAKKTVITQVMKKIAVESIVPIVISLKHKLDKLRSPLMRDLMRYLKELMKDYKNEVKEILSADKVLAAEIEYDLKQFDQENRVEVEQRRKEAILQRRVSVVPAVVPSAPSSCRTPQVVSKDEQLAAAAAAAAVEDEPDNGAPDMINRESVSVNDLEAISLVTPYQLAVQLERLETGNKHRNGETSSRIPRTSVLTSAVPSDNSRRADVKPNETPNRLLRSDVVRAVSTPHVAITNITFRGDIDGIPAARLSPILEA